MNNLLPYCGLVDVSINAFDKNLPVPKDLKVTSICFFLLEKQRQIKAEQFSNTSRWNLQFTKKSHLALGNFINQELNFCKVAPLFFLSFNGTWEFIFQKIRSLIRCVLPTSKPFHPYLHTFRWHCIKKISFLSQFLWWEVNSREHENLFFRKSRP